MTVKLWHILYQREYFCTLNQKDMLKEDLPFKALRRILGWLFQKYTKNSKIQVFFCHLLSILLSDCEHQPPLDWKQLQSVSDINSLLLASWAWSDATKTSLCWFYELDTAHLLIPFSLKSIFCELWASGTLWLWLGFKYSSNIHKKKNWKQSSKTLCR